MGGRNAVNVAFTAIPGYFMKMQGSAEGERLLMSCPLMQLNFPGTVCVLRDVKCDVW